MDTGNPNSIVTVVGQEQKIVATFIQLLAGGVKQYNLYPENHSIAKQHLKKILSPLTLHLTKHHVLHLSIENNNFLYDETIVYQGTRNENDLAFLLERDGLEWIEFLHGIEAWEIQSLLRIVHNHRQTGIEYDGNIVTALWDKDFPHLDYKRIELAALEDTRLNLQAFQVAPPPATIFGEQNEDELNNETTEKTQTGDEDNRNNQEHTCLTLTALDTFLWKLTDSEQFQLEALIRQEEGPDTSSIIDILFILLLLQEDPQESLDIMEFIQDRFQFCLFQQQFIYALRIITTLKKIDNSDSTLQHQLHPLITSFFQNIVRPESLRDLEIFFTSPDIVIPDNEIEALWKLLRTLPTSVLKSLAPLSAKIDLQRFGIPFISLLEFLGDQNPAILANVTTDLEEKVCLLLFPFVNRIRSEYSVPILTAMVFHNSKIVRKKALQLLIDWNSVDVRILFPLVDDPDPTIYQSILSIIEQQQEPAFELLLCKHIKKQRHCITNYHHIMSCYKTLGKIGSQLSIPFLTECLFQKSTLGTLFSTGGGAHKEGAAMALLSLNNDTARQVVQEGATSLIPDIRSACRKALGD